jgi:hypothetical protein
MPDSANVTLVTEVRRRSAARRSGSSGEALGERRGDPARHQHTEPVPRTRKEERTPPARAPTG